MAGIEIAEQEDGVGIERIGRGADPRDPRRAHEGLSGVDVGEDGQPQDEASRPVGGRQGIAPDLEKEIRLDADRIDARRGAEQRKGQASGDELAAIDHLISRSPSAEAESRKVWREPNDSRA